MTACQIIKAITDGQKINLSEIARSINISPQTMHNYWNGHTEWPFDVFQKCLLKLEHRIDIVRTVNNSEFYPEKNSPD